MQVAGLDGTKNGWICATFDGRAVSGFGAPDINEALRPNDPPLDARGLQMEIWV